MEWGTALLVWLASIALWSLLAALLPKTRWWVGTISGVTLGPLGVALVAVDVATYREPVTSRGQ